MRTVTTPLNVDAALRFLDTFWAECERQDALRAAASHEKERRDELPPRQAHVK